MTSLFDWSKGWAEIEKTRFGYRIRAGQGPGVYECYWFRFTHERARRKARKLIEKIDREHQRYQDRERLE